MKVRTFAISAALATASAMALASPASAQSFGGITLSFGTSGYNSYDYDDDDYAGGSYYTYDVPQYQSYYYPQYQSYYYQPSYARQAWARQEQIERWRAEQQRRVYWEHERRENRRGHDDDDGD